MSTWSPDQPGSAEPGLSHLLRALTAEGHPDELASRDAALAVFRNAARTRRRRAFLSPRLSAPARSVFPGRLVTAGAVGLIALAGLTAAAYAQALPAPVQQIAYSVFAPLGVPSNSSPRPVPPRTGPGGRGTTSGAAASASTVAQPGTGPASPGSAVSLTPTATPHRTKSPVTKPALRVVLLVVPGRVTDRLIATVAAGKPGSEVRLAKLVNGKWTVVADARLGPDHRVTFGLPATSAGGHFFRAAMPKTGAHPVIRSLPVWVPRHHAGAKVIGFPTPTPTPSPSGTSTPAVSPSPSSTPAPTLSSAPPPPTATASSPPPTAPTAQPTRHRHQGSR